MAISIRNKILFIFMLSSFIALGQNIEVVERNENFVKGAVSEAFDYIENGYELKEEFYVASLKGMVTNSKKSILSNLFNSFWVRANELGANSFRIKQVENTSDGISVEISLHYLSDEAFEEMIGLYPTNMVYVFGEIDKRKKTKKIKLNGEKIKLAPMEFISYQNKVGQVATIGIGGLLGARVQVKGRENRLPENFSLSGMGVGAGVYGGPGLSINTGRIYPIELNFGQFLIHVLTEKQ